MFEFARIIVLEAALLIESGASPPTGPVCSHLSGGKATCLAGRVAEFMSCKALLWLQCACMAMASDEGIVLGGIGLNFKTSSASFSAGRQSFTRFWKLLKVLG